MTLEHRLAVARGEQPADLILRNAQLVNVISGEVYPTDIVVQDGFIVALGAGYEAEKIIDVNGRYVAPGFIDAHVHIESSLVTPPQFARAVLPHGVTTVITDPHEMANVLGIDGIHTMLEAAKHGHMSMYVMAPSCVPATHMETSGATLSASDLMPIMDNPWVLGLAEVMNYPGVIAGSADVLDKLRLFEGRVIDGHCPALTGQGLNAYATAGIQSEHECTTVEESQEKLRAGLTIFIREGTATRNLVPLLPLITPMNHGAICFCTDDRIPASLLDLGSIDYMVRVAIEHGIDPIMAIRMGTINTARYFGLNHLGAIVPGRMADMIVFSDLQDLQVEMTFRHGVLVAENGQMIVDAADGEPVSVRPTMNVKRDSVDFAIKAEGQQVRVIGHVRDQIVTTQSVETLPVDDAGYLQADTSADILKMAVIERHHASGNIAVGFIKGFGLKRGAIAGTVAHDHHNLVVIGADDASMQTAVDAVIKLGGGIVATDGADVLAELALPIAGLLSTAPIEQVRRDYDAVIKAAQSLGSTLDDPLMAMSFMALEVIPELKLTDVGLVDVTRFEVVDLFA